MNSRVTSTSPTVLVVDDEPDILDLLSSVLHMSGFEVRVAATGADAVTSAAECRPDIVVLDVMLPDSDGYSVARRLRQQCDSIPVLFLTARDSVEDRIEGLRAGGDDYVCKPFSLEEVLLRVQAVLRRTQDHGPTDPDLLRYADLHLNADAHTVTRAGQEIWLSATEFRLLHYLMLNADRVVSKQQIIDRVWGSEDGRDGRVVETFMSQLRRKIDIRDPALIHTVRNVGYTLRSGGFRSAS
ncbi:response regulator transcription factor [Nocardia amikacinitolerans]|uniref:response regulator transcription factor n=1 Tax=Nocardia amikacinitolerans TaxID=756689 RepID=UPI0020A60909|nr:response regulator transcription factor [Nocardia amikacinitolerans]MCP2281108.1 two-component system, OmpR family, response regulator [Nocardia amikacinitolerans]MCP2300325.1 two-component system, OmpR family, response regulator [Nocardia amikacinitolerans]